MRIPRCRATVSEDIAFGPLELAPGRPEAKADEGLRKAGKGARPTQLLSLLASQETGAN